MAKLQFEEVESNLAGTVWRAQVPGGWIVRVTNENGYGWRDSVCFMPDPNHEWLKEPTEEEIQEALKMADKFYGREQ